ncbi:hypothetical protein P4111_28195, partial [Bacillus thuringiensis]|nr:hypothetical protein [Bacillus thuringiensis]
RKNQPIRFLHKISTVPKERPNVGHLGVEHPEVTLKETKGYFRRGTEKLHIKLCWGVSSSHN